MGSSPIDQNVLSISSVDFFLSIVGSIMDLPYIFKGDGSTGGEMILDPDLDIDAFIEQISGKLIEYLQKQMASFNVG